MKAVIFGTGMAYQQHKNFFTDIKILCFLDNDVNKWGKQLDGIPIVSPNKIHDYDYEYIFLESTYFGEMREQLIKLGVPEDRIIDQMHPGLFAYMNQIRKYENNHQEKGNRKRKGRILLISHDINLSGAPVVLGRLARLLHEEGYYVEVYSQDCGSMDNLLHQTVTEGISVSLFSRIELLDIDRVCADFDMVIVSTVTLYRVVEGFSGKVIPVIWWLHEEDDVYCSLQPDMRNTAGENIHVYAGGERAKRAYIKYSGNPSADILLYGLDEVPNIQRIKSHNGKLIFALIGFGCERKGQDIVYQAVSKQPDNWKDLAEIWFIGELPETQKSIYETLHFIKCMGSLSLDELKDIYDNIDVLLCPSLHDPMPVVVSEAMMHRKPCIVSDMTGQSEYILPYVNGLLCEAGNAGSLEAAMRWAAEHPEELERIGEAAYQVYKDYFSMESFKNKVNELLAKYLPAKCLPDQTGI